MSWLTLVLEIGGLLLATLIVASVLLGAVNRAALGVAAPAVAIVVFGVFIAPQLQSALSFLNTQRLMYRGLPAEKAREKCLVDGGNSGQAAFLEFVRRETPAKSRDLLVDGSPVDAACLSFVLMPRLLEADPRKAGWAIVTGGVPGDIATMIVPGTIRTFKAGQLVARLRQ